MKTANLSFQMKMKAVETWNYKKKQYVSLKNGSHGKSTVILSKETIYSWMDKL